MPPSPPNRPSAAPPPIPATARGDTYGLDMPAHPAALRAMGADFLTRACRAFGSLAPDNGVTRIVGLEPCPGGSTGQKCFLTVAYERDVPGLPTALFVKFSRDFTDSRRDHGRAEMAPEVPFAALSRLPGFPIAVPAALFADYEAATGTGIVITERIGFGADGIEPMRAKCCDHLTLGDPLPHYRTIVTALARLAGAHKAGALSPDIDARFPFDPVAGSADPIRDDDAACAAHLAALSAFAERHPRLLPDEVRDPAFLRRFAADVADVRRHEAAIQRHLTGDPAMIALCHWNAHIDNAWFWRDAAGTLRCGLIDWGRVGQITLGSALWGALSAAHHDIWDRHLDTLLALFAAEYRAAGGPEIDADALALHLDLHMAAMGTARMLGFPEVVLFRLPAAADAAGPLDPLFLKSEPARNCLHILTVLLKRWRSRDFGAAVRALAAGG